MSTLDMQQECQRLLHMQPMYLECKPNSMGPQGEVVELALIDSNGSKLLDELVHPKRDIDPKMTKIHGISNDIAQHALPWAEVWSQTKKLIGGRMVGVFDMDQRLSWMRQSHTTGFLRWDADPAKFFCIQKLHSHYQNDWDRSINNYRLFQLEEAAELVGLPSAPQTFHRRALEDALLARAILLVMAGWKAN